MFHCFSSSIDSTENLFELLCMSMTLQRFIFSSSSSSIFSIFFFFFLHFTSRKISSVHFCFICLCFSLHVKKTKTKKTSTTTTSTTMKKKKKVLLCRVRFFAFSMRLCACAFVRLYANASTQATKLFLNGCVLMIILFSTFNTRLSLLSFSFILACTHI